MSCARSPSRSREAHHAHTGQNTLLALAAPERTYISRRARQCLNIRSSGVRWISGPLHPARTQTMAHPESYTVYRWEEAMGPLVKAELPWKEPKEGEVVVKVLACGVCGTYVSGSSSYPSLLKRIQGLSGPRRCDRRGLPHGAGA